MTFFRNLRASLLVFLRKLSPSQTVILGYASYIIVISLLLWVPLTWQMPSISYVDHLFMAASSVSTTGLVTVNTPDAYNFWGELILLLGFQAGGLGYMTFGSFVLLASKGRLSGRRLTIGRSVFAMPEHFDTKAFIRRAVAFTLIVEALGAVGLYIAFSQAGLENPWWPAIFHSISAFCTAGFSVFPNSLEDFRTNVPVNVIVSISSILGAIGFIVVSDAYLALSKKTHRITLTSKIILIATTAGILLGTLAMFFDAEIAQLAFGDRLMTAFFQAMTALTTVGFNTFPIGQLAAPAVVMILVLMILGASPSGTGGGLKSTTWTAALAATWSAIRGRNQVTFLGVALPNNRVMAAFATFTLYLIIFVAGCYMVLATPTQGSFEDIVFEVASGLGTVGLSRGITGDLSTAAKLTITLLMYIGRCGVIALGLAAMASPKAQEDTPELEDVVV